ncbi:MAG: hypothetical protein QXP42_01380 [Candidatus Micrarchaeia archaeon]
MRLFVFLLILFLFYSLVSGDCVDFDGICPSECTIYSDIDCAGACGDGRCERNENKCSCPIDCGVCSGDVPEGKCLEFACMGGECMPKFKPNCCGNRICESGEEDGACKTDCVEECGNGVCGPNENACTCPQDCGACAAYLACGGLCEEPACTPTGCVCVKKRGCCGNLLCERGENYRTCRADCLPSSIKFNVHNPSSGEYFMRGEKALINATVLADGVPSAGFEVEAIGFFGSLKLLDDGMHGDGGERDGVFGGMVEISRDAPAGARQITLKARRLSAQGSGNFLMNIKPELDVFLYVDNKVERGGYLNFSGKVKKRGMPFGGNLRWSIVKPDGKVEGVIEIKNGSFSGFYHTTFVDLVGAWSVSVETEDEFGNSGRATANVLVYEMEENASIEILSPLTRVVRRGDEVFFDVVVRLNDNNVNDARVWMINPRNQSFELASMEDGRYGMLYRLHAGEPLGKQRFLVRAAVYEKNTTMNVETGIELVVVAKNISVRLDEPRGTAFAVGDSVPIVAVAECGDVSGLGAVANVGNGSFELKRAGECVFVGSFIPESEGAYNMTVCVEDAYGNAGCSDTKFEVKGKNAFLVLRENSVVIGAGVFLITLASLFLGKRLVGYMKRRRTKERKKSLEAAIKKLEHQYFEEGSISKEEYNRLLAEYEAEIKRFEKT